MANKVTLHTGRGQGGVQAVGGLVIPGSPQQSNRGAEGGDIQGDVTGATGAVINTIDPHHRNRGFRRYTLGRTVPITIQHDIANNNDFGFIKTGQCQFHAVISVTVDG